MKKTVKTNEERQPFALPMQTQINMPEIPRAFINNVNAKRILSHTVEEFAFEEQQVIYYYCYLSMPVQGIAKAMELTEIHVASVLGLYSERIKSLLAFFTKTLPHDSQDKLNVKEILL